MLSRSRSVLVAALWVAFAAPAFASDGILEINHTCATSTGCFADDTPGYPVQITQPGSYRLTSNLTVPASTDGLHVLTNGAAIDLGGFEVAGPVACTPTCPAAGSGTGIRRAITVGNQCSVANGKVRGFARDGIELSLAARVEDVTVTEVSGIGIYLGGGGFAARNLVRHTGQNGMRFDMTGSILTLYERNTIASTGLQSVLGGKPSGPNSCTDQLCGTSGNKFFYLTGTQHDGADADAACAAGFHMASLWELGDTSSLEYDTARGLTADDSGQGQPNLPPIPLFSENVGWVRTGGPSALGNAGPGESNCGTWSSSSASVSGTTIRLNSFWDSAAQFADPWTARLLSCDRANHVWCVQD